MNFYNQYQIIIPICPSTDAWNEFLGKVGEDNIGKIVFRDNLHDIDVFEEYMKELEERYDKIITVIFTHHERIEGIDNANYMHYNYTLE